MSLIPILVAVTVLCSAAGSFNVARAAAPDSDGAPHRPPNIIFIVLDTARADRMSYNGYRRLTTPNIDDFAHDGVIYRNAHSVAPWTLPSHMSMFTGWLPGQHGATWRAFATPENMTLGDILNKSFTLADPNQFLPVRLRTLGYTTVGFSSNAWVSRRTGFDVGFDAFYELWKESTFLRKAYEWVPPRVRTLIERLPADIRTVSEADSGDAGLVMQKLKEHVATRGTLRAPFFLFFNFIDPHFPYSPPLSWRYAFSNDVDLGEALALFRFDELTMEAGTRTVDVTRFSPFYDAEMNYVDFVVGRLLGWLREHQYYDDALIIVVSDHGEHLGEGGHFSHQFSVEEELLHIPLVIKYPGNVGRGTIVDSPLVSNLDLYETILTAAAQGRPHDHGITSSQNLADMNTFSRSFLIAEDDYSLPFLRLNHERCADFSIDDHRITQRVVFDASDRYTFVEHDGAQPVAAPVANSDAPGREAAAAFLRNYVSGLREGMLKEQQQPLDAATRERLRALGYVR